MSVTRKCPICFSKVDMDIITDSDQEFRLHIINCTECSFNYCTPEIENWNVEQGQLEAWKEYDKAYLDITDRINKRNLIQNNL